jgi:hypothetical protein
MVAVLAVLEMERVRLREGCRRGTVADGWDVDEGGSREGPLELL